MNHQEFMAAGFMFNNGWNNVTIDTVLEGADQKIYKVVYSASADTVQLQEGGTRNFIEPTRDFLHGCYVPLDLNRANAARFPGKAY
jgi:hypothetical protein